MASADDSAALTTEPPSDSYILKFSQWLHGTRHQKTALSREATLTPTERAGVLGETIHLDYMFFENDRDFCEIDDHGDGSGVIYITLCTAYLRGCLLPIVRS